MRRFVTTLAATLTLTSSLGVAAPTAHAEPRVKPERGSCRSTLAPGDSVVDVSFGSRSYPVRVHVPRTRGKGGARPLLLNLHPSSGNARRQAEISDMNTVSDEKGFVVAYPQGVLPLPPSVPADPDGGWAWNVPGVPTTAGEMPPAGSRDDVAYLRTVVSTLLRRGCLDEKRVYSTGFSGGARMSSALGCHAADVVAAIAPVAGVRAGRPNPAQVSTPEAADCRPSRPVPVVTFHGYVDTVNPFAGNPDKRWGYSVALATETWARLNGCRTRPQARTITDHVMRVDYVGCRDHATVTRYDVFDGGHTWPGSKDEGFPAGSVTQEIDASRLIWAALSRHRLRT